MENQEKLLGPGYRKSNGKVRSGFDYQPLFGKWALAPPPKGRVDQTWHERTAKSFRNEYSGSPWSWSRIFWSEYSDRNFSFHRFIPLPSSLHFCRDLKNGNSHFSWLAWLTSMQLFYAKVNAIRRISIRKGSDISTPPQCRHNSSKVVLQSIPSKPKKSSVQPINELKAESWTCFPNETCVSTTFSIACITKTSPIPKKQWNILEIPKNRNQIKINPPLTLRAVRSATATVYYYFSLGW